MATLGHDAGEALALKTLAGVFILSSPDAQQYPAWVDSDNELAPFVHSTWHCFNVTNPEEVVTTGAKPNLQEFGPLRYKLHRKLYNVSWLRDGDLMQYQQYAFYTPLDDATVQLQQLQITTVDIILQAALRQDPPTPDFVPVLYPATKEPMALWTSKTIEQLLWGYTDTTFNQVFPGVQRNDTSLAYSATQHSVHTMYTGKSSGSLAYQYAAWNGNTEMECCVGGVKGEATAGADSTCAPVLPGWDAQAVAGSFGYNFHMGVQPDETLTLATYDFGVYKHWAFTCDKNGWAANAFGDGPVDSSSLFDASPLTAPVGACDAYTIKGVTLSRFGVDPTSLSNTTLAGGPTAMAGTAALGHNGRMLGEKKVLNAATGLPNGVLNQSMCELRAPIFMSFPHFLWTDPAVAQGVTGLDAPDPVVDGPYFGVEPITGQVLDSHFHVQANARIQPITVQPLGGPFTYFPTLPAEGLYLPMCWGGIDAVASDAQAAAFIQQVYPAVKGLAAIRWIGVSLAIVGFLCGVYTQFHMLRRMNKGSARSGLADDEAALAWGAGHAADDEQIEAAEWGSQPWGGSKKRDGLLQSLLSPSAPPPSLGSSRGK